MKTLHKTILYFAVIAAICIATLLSCLTASYAYADNATSAASLPFEQSNVMDDLDGSTINGKEFNLKDYPVYSKGEPQVISFIEYGYSYYEDKQDDFALYVYVYNPTAVEIDTNSERNKIQFTYGEVGTYIKPKLQLINYSTEKDYEHVFYKFKIALTDGQKKSIIKYTERASRVYTVSEVELSINSELKNYPVELTFTYTGFGQGYGGNANATEGTLSLKVSNLKVSLSPKVYHTAYRPQGTNGVDEYTQDSLYSVYFSVPNEIIKQYGGFSKIHATWLNAVLVPMLVTGNKDIYKQLKKYVGQDIGYKNTDVGYSVYGGLSYNSAGDKNAQIAYNAFGYSYGEAFGSFYGWKQAITQLSGVFYADDGNADEYTLSSDILLKHLVDFSERFGALENKNTNGDDNNGGGSDGSSGGGAGGGGSGSRSRSADSGLVLDKYSPALFDSVDEDFVDISISADDKYSLTNEKISQHWWQKLFGGSYVEKSEVFKDIEAIHLVTDEDFKEDSKELICDNLYISTGDYSHFKAFYDVAKLTDSTVFLFRYQVSDYKAWEATEFIYGPVLGILTEKQLDTNAYFFQETVNLDFDIIDLTLTDKNGRISVIPVLMSPKDIIPSPTPPVIVTPDNGFDLKKLIALILGLIIFIVVIVLLYPIIQPLLGLIMKGLIWLVTAPFKALSKLFKKKKE